MSEFLDSLPPMDELGEADNAEILAALQRLKGRDDDHAKLVRALIGRIRIEHHDAQESVNDAEDVLSMSAENAARDFMEGRFKKDREDYPEDETTCVSVQATRGDDGNQTVGEVARFDVSWSFRFHTSVAPARSGKGE